jgi:hypothetical protein
MKQLLVIFFLISYSSLFAQSSTPVSPSTSPAKEPETKTAPKSESKTTEVKTAPKATEGKATSKLETHVNKELPPLQKEGGFLLLKGVKWQADNITQKSYVTGKEACEKDGLRLPSRDELIDAYTSKYPEFRNPSGNYVSGNRRASDRSTVWFVSFDNGHHNHGSLSREYNIRCVKVDPKPAQAKTPTPAETNK